MNKVIKVTEDEIFIGKDDGSIVKTEKSNASWEVKVGDEVELFSSGKTIILNLAKKVKEKKNNGFISWIAKYSQKTLPVVFSGLFALFLIALIVICSVPRGWKYSYKAEASGIEIESIIEFEDDDMIMSNYSNAAGIFDNETDSLTNRYKIESGKLYVYDNELRTFEYAGKISSTKIEVISEGIKLEYKENTMIALRTLSIVFMVIFAILDLGAIVVMYLTKRGVIKLDTQNAVETTTTAEVNQSNEAE